MLLVISIVLEASIAVIAVLTARQGRPYIYGLAFTFIAYVIYDLGRFMQWRVAKLAVGNQGHFNERGAYSLRLACPEYDARMSSRPT